MKIERPEDVAPLIESLARVLWKLLESIAQLEAETRAVDGVRKVCDENYLVLEHYRQNILAGQNRTEREEELTCQISDIIVRLRTVREAISKLVEVLKIRDNSSGSSRRVPRDFYRLHSDVEAAIGNVLPMMNSLADEDSRSAGPPEHRRNIRENLISLDDSGDAREYRQPARGPRRRVKFG